MQAVLRTRQLVYSYKRTHVIIRKLQCVCKGYLVRTSEQIGKIYAAVRNKNNEEKALKMSGNKNYKHVAETNMQKRLAELNREYTVENTSMKRSTKEEEGKTTDDLIDEMFSFHSGLSPVDSVSLKSSVLEPSKNSQKVKYLLYKKLYIYSFLL